MGSEAEVVGVLDWAVLGGAEAVPGRGRFFWFRLAGGRAVGGSIQGVRVGGWRDVRESLSAHCSRLHAC